MMTVLDVTVSIFCLSMAVWLGCDTRGGTTACLFSVMLGWELAVLAIPAARKGVSDDE